MSIKIGDNLEGLRTYGTRVFLRTKAAKTMETIDHQFNENINAGAGRIFERVADRVSHNTGFVSNRTFSFKVALFNMLLGIIPGPAGVSHHNSQEKTRSRGTDQKPADTVNPE